MKQHIQTSYYIQYTKYVEKYQCLLFLSTLPNFPSTSGAPTQKSNSNSMISRQLVQEQQPSIISLLINIILYIFLFLHIHSFISSLSLPSLPFNQHCFELSAYTEKTSRPLHKKVINRINHNHFSSGEKKKLK